MLEEVSNHSSNNSIADIENSITNSLVIKREDENDSCYNMCSFTCKLFTICIGCVLIIFALVMFVIKVLL